ncbi:hypothetical protein N9485_00695 [Luminiphilus sp.]|nr:hypothetical protein [Luminiphilus sp.]
MLKDKGLCFAVILTAASGWLGTITSVPAIAAESANPRVFWQSLSPAERKLPRNILVKGLLAQGREVPSSWQPKPAAESRSRVPASDADAEAVYRVTGDDLLSLHNIMALVDIPVRTSSESRSYVVVTLTDAQVVEIAQYGAVQRIQRVKGPTAQGNTEAWTAHRFDGMDGINEPSNLPGKPELTGSGVIIGVISLPATQADVDDLVTDTSLPPLYDENNPSSEPTLYLYEGGLGETTEGLSAIDDTAGVDAGLNMVQVIRDIAPGAQVVLASPGAVGDPQDMANLIEALVVGRSSSGEAGYIPPVDIIVDDLDFLSQNPFRVDLISEAIAGAKEEGTLYVTAAGDGGHHLASDSGSNVYISEFNGIAPPSDDGFLAGPTFGELHSFSSGANGYYLETTQSLTDLCLFYNDDPAVAADDYDVIIWNDSNGDNLIDDDEYYGPVIQDSGGECFALDAPAGQFPIISGTRIIVNNFVGGVSDRLMLVGEREKSSFVNSEGADDITATFSLTTPGAIRGHAYSSDALTVGGAPYFEEPADTVVPYWDTDPDDDSNTDGGALAGTVSANAYSADGESSSQRLFWDKDNENNWQAVPSTDARAQPNKPDLIAASAIGVRTVEPSEVVDETFHGTSASAGVVAATAALYWQFREWRISEESSQDEVAPEDILRAVQAAARGNTDQWSRILGYGVLDAPAPLESPLPPTELTLVEQSLGVLQLSYERAFNDVAVNPADAFLYYAECSYPSYPQDDELLKGFLKPADVNGAQVPVFLYPANNRIGEEVTCEVATIYQGNLEWEGSGSATVTTASSVLSPPVVTMTAKSMGVALQFAASPDDSAAAIDYDAVCTPNLPGWPGVVTPHTSESPSIYERLANPGTTINCSVTATVDRAGGDPALTLTAVAAGSATAGTPIATSLTVTPDAGGVSVRWIADPNLVSGATNSVTLKCTQGGASNVLVEQSFTQASSYFVEADQSAPVQCSVTTALSGSGVTTINQSAVSASASADEESVGGLPIWLLYIATQPG